MESGKKKLACLTMDVEDLSEFDSLVFGEVHCKVSAMDGFDAFLSLLSEENIKGTFFVLSSRLEIDKERLLRLKEERHEIALHGKDHLRVDRYNQEDCIKDLIDAKKEIEKKLGVTIYGNRFPGWIMPNGVDRVLKETGLLYDCTYTATSKNYPALKKQKKLDSSKRSGAIYDFGDEHYEIAMPSAPILAYSKAAIGGGPMVRFSDTASLKRAIKKATKKGDEFVFYCHPFEFSSSRIRKRIGLPFYRYYYLTAKRRRYLKRVKKIIAYLRSEGYEFVTCKELIDIKKEEKEKTLN